MKSCELSVIKYILFTFNLVFAISGIGLIVAGALVLADVGEFSDFMEGRILAPPVVLIVTGCIVFLVASLGCYGAIRESYYMLIAFALCLLIILIIELAVGIAAAVYKNDFQTTMKELMRSSMDRFQNSQTDRDTWNKLQSQLKCCGVESPADWPENSRPKSCCYASREGAPQPEDFHCQKAKPEDGILYNDGCFYQLQMKADASAKILIGVGIGIAFIEVIGIILACWLASAIKNKD